MFDGPLSERILYIESVETESFDRWSLARASWIATIFYFVSLRWWGRPFQPHHWTTVFGSDDVKLNFELVLFTVFDRWRTRLLCVITADHHTKSLLFSSATKYWFIEWLFPHSCLVSSPLPYAKVHRYFRNERRERIINFFTTFARVNQMVSRHTSFWFYWHSATHSIRFESNFERDVQSDNFPYLNKSIPGLPWLEWGRVRWTVTPSTLINCSSRIIF